MEYSEYAPKGWKIYEVRNGTSYPKTDYHKTEQEAWDEYREIKLYGHVVKH